MILNYNTDADGRITSTTSYVLNENAALFNFPANFDFFAQSDWRVVAGDIVYDPRQSESQE